LLPTPPQASELGLVPWASPPCAVQIFHPALDVWMSRETDWGDADGLAASSSKGSVSKVTFIIIRDGCGMMGARCLHLPRACAAHAANPLNPTVHPMNMPSPGIRKRHALMLSVAAMLSMAILQAQQAATPAAVPPSSSSPAQANPVPTPPPAASPPAKETKPATATPIDIKKSELGGTLWNPDWDEIIEKALPDSLLSTQVPRDVRRYCPRFYRMSDTDKRAFWAYFFQALAGAEAGLNPTSHVRHIGALKPSDGVTHLPIHCEGLLQLTYEDSVRYGCNFDWDADRNLKPSDPARTILQPKNNLECGVKILTRQIIDNHEPLFWKLSYWSTLRPGTPSFSVFTRQMISPPPACGYPGRARRILDRVLSFRRLVAGR
jgi:hypothetical protein